MYIFLRSDDSVSTHPTNNPLEFLSELPKTVTADGNYTCALVECVITPDVSDSYIIYCDIVENSCVHGKLLPVLNIIDKSGTVDLPYYIPLSRGTIHRIRIRLLNKEGTIPEKKPSTCRIVLHIRKEDI